MSISKARGRGEQPIGEGLVCKNNDNQTMMFW